MPRDRRSGVDYGFRGVFELRDAHDLLKKLRHDAQRLQANPIDSYAAFDFFVTANCIVDWVWPSASREQLAANRREEVLPRICWHLADGTKHFLLDAKHDGVDGTKVKRGAFDDVSDPTAVDVGVMTVELEPSEAAELGQSSIEVRQLALLIVEYWSRRIGS
jgi:hypothetical protein